MPVITQAGNNITYTLSEEEQLAMRIANHRRKMWRAFWYGTRFVPQPSPLDPGPWPYNWLTVDEQWLLMLRG